MKSILPLLASLASGEIGLAINNAKREAIFLAIIAFFALVAVVFALAAAEVALAAVYGPLYACLIIAGSALVLCVLVLVVMKIAMARARRRARLRREANQAAYTTAAMTFLPFALRSKAALAIGIPLAALAGYLLVPGRNRKGDDE